jgi:hypothetical protein
MARPDIYRKQRESPLLADGVQWDDHNDEQQTEFDITTALLIRNPRNLLQRFLICL